ncbi:hypothetical protein YC2023_095911 [Brassica napus]
MSSFDNEQLGLEMSGHDSVWVVNRRYVSFLTKASRGSNPVAFVNPKAHVYPRLALGTK